MRINLEIFCLTILDNDMIPNTITEDLILVQVLLFVWLLINCSQVNNKIYSSLLVSMTLSSY